MAKLPKDIHKEIFEDICLNLLNCADCGKDCNPRWRLSCNAGLIIIDENTFEIDPYSNKTNEQLIQIAENNGYTTKVVTKDEDVYLEFQKK